MRALEKVFNQRFPTLRCLFIYFFLGDGRLEGSVQVPGQHPPGQGEGDRRLSAIKNARKKNRDWGIAEKEQDGCFFYTKKIHFALRMKKKMFCWRYCMAKKIAYGIFSFPCNRSCFLPPKKEKKAWHFFPVLNCPLPQKAWNAKKKISLNQFQKLCKVLYCTVTSSRSAIFLPEKKKINLCKGQTLKKNQSLFSQTSEVVNTYY